MFLLSQLLQKSGRGFPSLISIPLSRLTMAPPDTGQRDLATFLSYVIKVSWRATWENQERTQVFRGVEGWGHGRILASGQHLVKAGSPARSKVRSTCFFRSACPRWHTRKGGVRLTAVGCARQTWRPTLACSPQSSFRGGGSSKAQEVFLEKVTPDKT